MVWTGSPHGEHETGLRPTIVAINIADNVLSGNLALGKEAVESWERKKIKPAKWLKILQHAKNLMKALGSGAL